jgi:hypothetical protein
VELASSGSVSADQWLPGTRVNRALGSTADGWTSAYDGDGKAREGAWVADIFPAVSVVV